MSAAIDQTRQVFRIRDWNNSYERNRSRELRFLEYVPFPNLMPDLSYVRLVTQHPNGAAHFGIWAAIVFIASRCLIRGTLVTDSGDPLEICDIAAVSRMPESMVNEAIPRFILIGWLERAPIDAQQPEVKPQVNGHANGSNGHTPVVIGPFEEWWKMWTEGTGQSSNRSDAEKQWAKSVSPETVSAAMECTKNFVTSDRTVRGIGIPNPSKFIRENSKDGWKARFNQGKKSRSDRVDDNLTRMYTE